MVPCIKIYFIKMTKKMQPCGTMYCPFIVLHVSSDIIAQHQELLCCIFTASGDTYARQCLPVSWENQKSYNSPTKPAGSDVRTYVSPEAVKIQFRSS
jgi:hypothetical protein